MVATDGQRTSNAILCTVNVNRNSLTDPVFRNTNFETTINETHPTQSSVFALDAFDPDDNVSKLWKIRILSTIFHHYIWPYLYCAQFFLCVIVKLTVFITTIPFIDQVIMTFFHYCLDLNVMNVMP